MDRLRRYVGGHRRAARLGPADERLILQEAALLFALLLFLGGRVIAPAAAGAIERAGGRLEARVQPRIEGALLVIVVLAAMALAAPQGRPLAGGLALVAAVPTFVRLARWRLWACRSRPDLWCLGIGYAWLGAGLVLLGLAWWLRVIPATTAAHAITVGALGTLTTAVMACVRLTRRKWDPAREAVLPWLALAMSAAALARLTGSGSMAALTLAAALWSIALLLLLGLFWRVPARR